MNTKLATAQIRVKNWAAIIQERNESGLSVKETDRPYGTCVIKGTAGKTE